MEPTKKLKQTLWESKGMPDLGNYTALPVYFSRELMVESKGVSPQFWKFTTIMWRELLAPVKNPNPPPQFTTLFQFKFTYEQLTQEFHIHSKAVARAIAAYEVCGFMSIKKGRQKTAKDKGEPTILQYHKDATLADWQAFIRGLAQVCIDDRVNHRGGSDMGFKVALAWRVRDVRLAMKLPVHHFDKWLDDMKLIGVISGDGSVKRQKVDHHGLRTWEEKYNADPYRYHECN
jgi:hypothetical protein